MTCVSHLILFQWYSHRNTCMPILLRSYCYEDANIDSKTPLLLPMYTQIVLPMYTQIVSKMHDCYLHCYACVPTWFRRHPHCHPYELILFRRDPYWYPYCYPCVPMLFQSRQGCHRTHRNTPSAHFMMQCLLKFFSHACSRQAWSQGKKDEILKSRVEGTKAIVDAINGCKKTPKKLVCASAVGLYGYTQGAQVFVSRHAIKHPLISGVC